MNRAKRYSGPFTLAVALLGLAAGLYLGAVTMAPKPEIRTVVQSPNHVASSMRNQDDALGECLAKNRALQSMDNREGQTPAVTPQPYVLHPGQTPLRDPTQDAYYRALLKEGRFPTSGSDAGRPR